MAVLAVLSGCGSAEPQGQSGAAVRDSAGITIVSPQRDEPRSAPWTVASEPHWSVGELDGDANYLLSRVAGALDLGDGHVVIADGMTNELRFFDPEGRWTQTRGGEGEGPGEFEYLRALEFCHPGGFVAFDLNWQKNSYLRDGTFVEKTVLRVPSGITPYSLACDDQGNFLILGWGLDMGSGPVIGFHTRYDRLLLADSDGEIRADLGERLVSERIGTESGSRPHPAGHATTMALHDGMIFVGSGEDFEVEVRNLDGTLTHLVRGPDIPREVTEAMKDAYLNELLDRIDDEDRRAFVRTQVSEWEWPERAPAYTDIRVDGQGVIWAKRFSLGSGDPERWSLLDLERGYLGDLELGPDQELLSIGEEDVLVRVTDDLDVERVAKLALNRGNDS